MDKRVIMIIAILIVGIGCMYVVVDNSYTIGHAITTFSKTTITLPDGFSVGDTDGKSAELYNKKSIEKINIHDLGKGDRVKDSFKNVTETYKNNPKYSNINDETKNVNGVEVLQISAETNNTISSSSIFYYYDHTYRIDMSGFNDMNKVNDVLEFIIKTLQPDYKQAQD